MEVQLYDPQWESQSYAVVLYDRVIEHVEEQSVNTTQFSAVKAGVWIAKRKKMYQKADDYTQRLALQPPNN